MTLNIYEMKVDIINVITRLDDFDKLQRIYQALQIDERQSVEKSSQNLSFDDIDTVVKTKPSFDQLVAEQNYPSITYNEVRNIAKDIEWEHSLEELLDAID